MAGRRAGAAGRGTPLSGSRRLVVTFGSFALHGPPPQEEGGKHQGPEARPKVKEHQERDPPPQCHPCSWNGQPAPAAFPEMVVGGRGGWLSPHPLGHCRLRSVSPLSPGFSLSQGPWSPCLRVRAPQARPGLGLEWWPRPALGPGRAGSPVCYMVQKESPALARASGGGRVLPPRSPTSTGRVQAPN